MNGEYLAIQAIMQDRLRTAERRRREAGTDDGRPPRTRYRDRVAHPRRRHPRLQAGASR
jgi:hypothetical protein